MKTWEGRVQFALAVLAAVCVFIGGLMEWSWALVLAGFFVLLFAIVAWESMGETSRGTAIEFLVKAFIAAFFGGVAYGAFASAKHLVAAKRHTPWDDLEAAFLTLLACLFIVGTLIVLSKSTDDPIPRHGGGSSSSL